MNVLDLFSGIGGFSLGLERAGMRTVAFCEIDPYCRAVLAKHWPDVPVFGDVRELTAEVLANAYSERESEPRFGQADCGPAADRIIGTSSIDVICGGFPCQDISVAGKGAGIGGERSGLWSEYARIIGEVRPKYAIVENVAALLGRGIERVLGDLAALGFDAEWHCIPASAVGAPHRRDRLWLVAYASGAGLEGREQPAPSWTLGQPPSGRREAPDADSQPSQRLTIAWGECGHWRSEPDIRRMVDGLSSRLDGDLNASLRMDSVAGEVGLPETRLRDLWRQLATRPAPQGPESDEQLGGELADALPDLPHALALAGGQSPMEAASRFLHRMRQACEAVGALRDASQPTVEAWQSLSDEEAEGAFLAACGRTDWRSGEWLGVGRVANKVPARVDRLRALGNAVVPQVPEIIGRAIMSIEREQYDADDDITKSFDEAYRAIRERMANGGPGWTPKP